MVDKILREKTIQLEAGKAKPGANLASFGINMMKLCQDFNNQTKGKEGEISVKITVFETKTGQHHNYQISIEGTPIPNLIKKIISDRKEISENEIKIIAKENIQWFNTDNIDKIVKTIIGTVKSMNVKII